MTIEHTDTDLPDKLRAWARDTDIPDKLRAWTRGTVTEKPAVELLIRADNGRWLNGPWVKDRTTDRPWIDWEVLHYKSGVYSSSERTFLAAVASLGSEDIQINLSDTIVRLDPLHLSLLFTALRAAAQNDGEWPA